MTPADLDALIERIPDVERKLIILLAKLGIPAAELAEIGMLSQAAAALAELRDRNAELAKTAQREVDNALKAEAEVARLTERISPDAKAIAESLRQWSDEDVRIASGQLPPLEHRQKTMGYIAARYIEALWLNFERAEARIAALEAERADLIKINNKWAREWDAMREERDALKRTTCFSCGMLPQIDAARKP